MLPFTRRSLLASAAAATLKAADSPRVIDAHVHFYDPTRPQGVPWPAPRETILYKPTYPDRYLDSIRPCTVDGVIAVEASPWLEDNLWLLNVGDRTPLVKAVVGNIAPGHPDFRDALTRFSKHPLFRGIRIGAATLARALAEPRISADLKFLAASNLALDVLLNDASVFDGTARLSAAIPDLRIILGHLPIDSRPGPTAITRYPNIYAKISNVVRRVSGQVPDDPAFYKASLDQMWDIFGPERVIYASNWPVCELVAPYATVFRVMHDYLTDKNPELSEQYFWKNSQRAYQWRAA